MKKKKKTKFTFHQTIFQRPLMVEKNGQNVNKILEINKDVVHVGHSHQQLLLLKEFVKLLKVKLKLFSHLNMQFHVM
jgi:hypothetical protein